MYYRQDNGVAVDSEDRCGGCGAGYAPAHGAFLCGYPLADCPAMFDEDEEVFLGPEEAPVADVVIFDDIPF